METLRSPVAMISYSWKDDAAAELLHDELTLRCFHVIHDRHTFADGSRVPTNMERGVADCDVFVAYLTPHSLYLDAPPDAARPALEQELIPALQRRRASLGSGEERPIVIPLSHGLGDRTAASDKIRKLTGEHVNSLWSYWLDQDEARITQPEAAEVASRCLHAFLSAQPLIPPVNLNVATRGSSPMFDRLTIDGTRLFGEERKPGFPEAWTRFVAALSSVERQLKSVYGGGKIRVNLACHLSAAIATGRHFHQASGWSPEFATRHGFATPSPGKETAELMGALDRYGASGDLIVDIDLIGHDVADRASELARYLDAGGRLSLYRTGHADLSPQEISQLARCVAERIRDGHAKLRPAVIHVALSAPAAFAGLLGHHLSALQADIVSYELGSEGYVETVRVPCTAP